MGVLLDGWKAWGELTGRYYGAVESYRAQGAEVLLVTMGSMGETASEAVDGMRGRGELVGVVKIRLWRPFPFEEFREAVRGAKVLVVFDRALSYGGPGGPVSSEVRAALYGQRDRPRVVDYVGGLGGRDVSPGDFERMVREALRGDEDRQEGYRIYGVRE
jgi:pyruvate ferredoxin oxidoreductase alpha subunit